MIVPSKSSEGASMNPRNANAASVGDVLFNASRQVWLAGLGAAVVTRDWAEKEAGVVFRNLVREGTAIESRAIRVVGDRLESSFVQANAVWKRARTGVTSAVKAYADTATMLVRETLPVSLPKPALVEAAPKRKPRKAAKRAAKAPARTRRTTRTTTR
jgi:hypothetical protein